MGDDFLTNVQTPLLSPGEMIREKLAERGWTQEDLARVLGRLPSRVTEVIQGKIAISSELAFELEAALGVSAADWLRAEAMLRMSLTKANTGDVRRRARLYELGPVKELQKRGWIKTGGSVDDLEREILQFYKIKTLEEEPSIHGALRKTDPFVPATPAQRAWAFRVRQLGALIPAASVTRYNESKLNICLSNIRKLASYSAGVSKIPALLMRYGIRFVVVEGLSGAKIDGFATWLDQDSPVIGMSLKFDRLDSFWFTLGHEMSHIKHRDIVPVDGDASGYDGPELEVKPLVERRADKESAETFIPGDELESFILRVGPLYSTDKINQFANRIKIHPNIIVGQLKHRGEIGHSTHNKAVVPIRESVIASAVTDGWGKFINSGVIL